MSSPRGPGTHVGVGIPTRLKENGNQRSSPLEPGRNRTPQGQEGLGRQVSLVLAPRMRPGPPLPGARGPFSPHGFKLMLPGAHKFSLTPSCVAASLLKNKLNNHRSQLQEILQEVRQIPTKESSKCQNDYVTWEVARLKARMPLTKVTILCPAPGGHDEPWRMGMGGLGSWKNMLAGDLRAAQSKYPDTV